MTEHICPKSPDKTLPNNQSKESQTTKLSIKFGIKQLWYFNKTLARNLKKVQDQIINSRTDVQ